MSEVCCKPMHSSHWPYYGHGTCGRPAKITVGGKHYCGLHDPVKRKERQDKIWAEREKNRMSGRAVRQMELAAPLLANALDELLAHYVRLVESGDAGHWDAEKEPQVIAARAALAKVRGDA